MPNKFIIDLTRIFSPSMPVHPYDESLSIEQIRNLKTHQYNDWRLTSGMHIGTHIDGPGHLTDSTALLSDLPPDRFVSPGYLVDARNRKLNATLLANMPDAPNLIVLVLTGQDKNFGKPEYFTEHPVFEQDFAQELVNRKIKMVGIDFFSPDKYPFPIHKQLFKHNILIAENLTGLEQLLSVKAFDVIALPLKLETDSALARVIALIID